MEDLINAIAKFNFWDGNTPALGYSRTAYVDKIGKYIGNKLLKVLVGQRRAGKSYVLRQIADRLIRQGVAPRNILYLNKEYIVLDGVRDYMQLEELLNVYIAGLQPEGKLYLLIDEIQMIDGWERFVNSHSQNFARECEIFITGSNSNLLSGELATLLSGRYVQFEIMPYSFIEYCRVTGREENMQSYTDYLQTGALPELFNLNDSEMRRNYISAIKDTVMLRDIVNRYGIKDVKLLDDLFAYLVCNASNLVSISNIINYFASKRRKVTYDTVTAYIGYLENSFIIHKAERYNIRGKELLSGNCKYYINDLSYRNYLYSGFGYWVGYMLENAVYISLRRVGYSVYVGVNVGYEVDFVAIRGGEKMYVQVAMQLVDEATVEREYRPLQKIADSYPKYIVSMDAFCLPVTEGIIHIQAWSFDGLLGGQGATTSVVDSVAGKKRTEIFDFSRISQPKRAYFRLYSNFCVKIYGKSRFRSFPLPGLPKPGFFVVLSI